MTFSCTTWSNKAYYLQRLYLRSSLVEWLTLYSYFYINLHSYFRTVMLSYIHISLHLCYLTFIFPYIYVTLHSCFLEIYVTLYSYFYKSMFPCINISYIYVKFISSTSALRSICLKRKREP